MGILDSILANVVGGGASSPMGGVLSQLLGGGNQGATAQGGSGLSGLLGQLRQAGLGSQVDSWVGNGQNQPVSPQQLHTAFGDQQVNTMADQAGMQPHDFLSQLSQHLPNAVNGMTPNERVPDEGTVSV